jgi:hypothetical protein
MGMYAPMLFQWQVICFEVTQHEFSRMGNVGPWQHKNMSCFGGNMTLVLVAWKSHTSKHNPQNLKLKTYHPLKHVKFQWATQHVFQWIGSSNPKTYYLLKHVNFQELCFNPMHPSSMFPHAIPIHAPWPIHDTLDLFQLSHALSSFR